MLIYGKLGLVLPGVSIVTLDAELPVQPSSQNHVLVGLNDLLSFVACKASMTYWLILDFAVFPAWSVNLIVREPLLIFWFQVMTSTK